MKKLLKSMILLIAVSLVVQTGCKKEDPSQSSIGFNEQNMSRGAHARTFSSVGIQKWMNVELQIMKTITGISNLAMVRPFSYTGIALYESVIPGMPSYATLVGQLNELPSMPPVINNLTYHWGSSANASMAKILKLMFPTMGAANLATVDSLESALNAEYSAGSDAATIDRSIEFGRGVAQIVYDWSVTDGNAHLNDPYTVLTGPGMWVPTPPAFSPNPLGPYWKNLRVMVSGSGNNAQPPAPPAYSEVPGSEFYNMVNQVYTVSQTLTQAQIDQGMYWRDVPGLTTAGHYVSIIKQVLAQENSSLEIAAVAYGITAITLYDVTISTWETKFTYSLIRPVSYIRTVLGHPSWNPLLTTPGHPEYSSGHASLSASVAVALTSVFGDNYSFTDHSYDYLGFPARSFSSFNAFAEDAGNSRLYAGIHYQLSIDRSFVQGRKVAQNILSTLIVKKP